MTPRPVAALALVVLLVLAGCAGAEIPGGSTTVPAGTTEEPATETPPDATRTDTQSANGTLEVHFINVGQASSTLVVGPTGETMLIDSGDFTDDGEYVLSYLERREIERIDHLVTTHAHADHIGGHAEVIEHYETEADGIGAVYDPGVAASTQVYDDYLDAVERHDVTLYRTLAGDEIQMDGVAVDVLSPPEDYLADRDLNENSLVLRVNHGRTRFLFTGDADRAAEDDLVDEYGAGLASTALQAGHHGAAGSSGAALLDAVDPRVVVISSAYDSEYGHPHEETLERLADRSVRTYWTAVHGDVVLESDGEAVTVATQRDATTAPLDLQDASPISPGTTDAVEPRIRIPVGGEDLQTPTDDGDGTETPSSTPTQTATDGGTPEGALAVAEINEDAPGDDRENLEEEYVVFENRGDAPLDLTGWTVEDEAEHEYTFPDGFTVDPDASVILHTGSGTDNDTDLYWGSERPIWNNDGDTVVVRDASDRVVIEHEYGG